MDRISLFLSSLLPECNYNNCVYAGKEVTPQSDAVFVYAVGLDENFPQPPVRLPHQVFVFSAYEPVTVLYSTAISRKLSWYFQSVISLNRFFCLNLANYFCKTYQFQTALTHVFFFLSTLNIASFHFYLFK